MVQESVENPLCALIMSLKHKLIAGLVRAGTAIALYKTGTAALSNGGRSGI